MIEANLFSGRQVRLMAMDPERDAPLFTRWGRDGEYARLLDSDPPRLWSVPATQSFLEKQLEQADKSEMQFMIQTLAEARIIGFASLDGIAWSHGDAWIGIGLGEREYWDQGYGSDAMQILVRFAFTELNLGRLTLNVFEFNPRAIRVYQKLGFREEGRLRQALRRDGQRWDLVFMGLLREDWEKSKS